jgi:hypothetical protein
LVLSIHKLTIRVWWFLFAVLPGLLLRRLHLMVSQRNGSGEVRLLPVLVYRLAGLLVASVLFVLFMSLTAPGPTVAP